MTENDARGRGQRRGTRYGADLSGEPEYTLRRPPKIRGFADSPTLQPASAQRRRRHSHNQGNHTQHLSPHGRSATQNALREVNSGSAIVALIKTEMLQCHIPALNIVNHRSLSLVRAWIIALAISGKPMLTKARKKMPPICDAHFTIYGLLGVHELLKRVAGEKAVLHYIKMHQIPSEFDTSWIMTTYISPGWRQV